MIEKQQDTCSDILMHGQKINFVKKSGISQFIRYSLVGAAQNGICYLLYLLLTIGLGIGPKVTIAVCYPVGVFITYLGNRKVTFNYQGAHGRAGLRFILTYAGGYAINLLGLYIFSDVLGYAHQWVQLGIMAFLVGWFFLLLKFFVFPHGGRRVSQ